MKNAIIFFLFGVIAGVCTLQIYQRKENTTISSTDGSKFISKARATVEDASTKTQETAGQVKDATLGKLEEWHLTPDEIKADLAKTGQVVRTKVHAAGVAISDTRVVAVIKAKYVLDRDLSAVDLTVDVKEGDVTLTGTVASPELIGRAVQLALDTEGVHTVTAKLAVAPQT